MAKKVSFESKIRKVGNSLGLLVPKNAINEGKFKEKKIYRVILNADE